MDTDHSYTPTGNGGYYLSYKQIKSDGEKVCFMLANRDARIQILESERDSWEEDAEHFNQKYKKEQNKNVDLKSENKVFREAFKEIEYQCKNVNKYPDRTIKVIGITVDKALGDK